MNRRVVLLLSFDVGPDVPDDVVRSIAADAHVQVNEAVDHSADGSEATVPTENVRQWLSIGGVPDDGDHPLGPALGDLCVEDWPEHMTCSEAESLALVLSCVGADALAGELVASHAGGDDDPEDMHHDG